MGKGGGGGGGSRGGGSSGGGSAGGVGAGIVLGGGLGASAGGHGGGYSSGGGGSNDGSDKDTIYIVVFSCLGAVLVILICLCRYKARKSRLDKNRSSDMEVGHSGSSRPSTTLLNSSSNQREGYLPPYSARVSRTSESTPPVYPVMESSTPATATSVYPDISGFVSRPPAYDSSRSDEQGSTVPNSNEESTISPSYPLMPLAPASAYPAMPEPISLPASSPSTIPSYPPPVSLAFSETAISSPVYPSMPQAPNTSASSPSTSSSYPPMPQTPASIPYPSLQ